MATPDRTELVDICLHLSKSEVKKYQKEIIDILAFLPYKEDMDLLQITYSFKIEYFKVLEGLKAITKLCKIPNALQYAEWNELKHQRCLLYDTLRELDTLLEEQWQPVDKQ
ncbi:MAG: hypothetical protein M0Q12_09425 [Synergistaceae bacterium]|jgi:hypothetical protein|nr:hypothetical protein [Synergistaceae bacterium]